ncbi:leptin b [Polymixia lowei]
MAQTTLVHIKNLRSKLPETPQIEVSSPSIEGLTISFDLGLLENKLPSPSLELLSQIQADVSSLAGQVCSLAETMACPVQARMMGEANNYVYPESQLYLSLMKVQCYLEKFIVNKDKLKIC